MTTWKVHQTKKVPKIKTIKKILQTPITQMRTKKITKKITTIKIHWIPTTLQHLLKKKKISIKLKKKKKISIKLKKKKLKNLIANINQKKMIKTNNMNQRKRMQKKT